MAESDCSINGDDDESRFVMPYVYLPEKRSFNIPKLSYVEESSYAISEESNDIGQQTQDLPTTNKTGLCKSYIMTTDDNLSDCSGSSCEIIEKSNTGEASVKEHISMENNASEIGKCEIFDEVKLNNDVNIDEEFGHAIANELPKPKLPNSNANMDGELVNEKVNESAIIVVNDDASGNDANKEFSPQIVEEDGVLNLCKRDRMDRCDGLSIATSASTLPDTKKLHKNAILSPFNGNYLQNATKNETNRIDSAVIPPPIKSIGFFVHPTQIIAPKNSRMFSDNAIEVLLPLQSPKGVKTLRSERAMNSQNITPQQIEQSLKNCGQKTTDVPNSSERIECEIGKSLPRRSPSLQIVHPTQFIRRAEPIPSQIETNAFVQIEDDESRKKFEVTKRYSKPSAETKPSKRPTTITIRADVHSTPAEIAEIHLKRDKASELNSMHNVSTRKKVSRDAIDLDAIEIIAQPKNVRKNDNQSTEESGAFVPSQSQVMESSPYHKDDPIYDAHTQTILTCGTPPFQAPIVDNYIQILDDDDDEPIKPPKPRRKASTVRTRAKAIPKTQRKTKNTPANHVNFDFDTPQPKGRQNRKKANEKPIPVSPCSEIASKTTTERGSPRKRKLYNKDAELDKLEDNNDDDYVFPANRKRSNAARFEELLETTVSTAADIEESRKENPKKFFNRVAENMHKISSQTKKVPSAPAVDAFDSLRMETNNVRSSENVSYSYRSSTQTNSKINNKQIYSTKTSTCKKSVIFMRFFCVFY